MHASLMVLVGKQKGREIPLPEALFVIGRDPLCHLRPHSSLVSRRHCAIARWGGRVLVRDLKSANGTFLNKKKLAQQVEVKEGDVLDVGDLSFSFHIVRNEDEPVQPLNEAAVQWLFEDKGDSAVLDPGMSTQMLDMSFLNDALDKDKDGKDDPAKKKKKVEGSGNLSAGKYMKDYLDS